jgi:uncharacterized membrane protein YfcA
VNKKKTLIEKNRQLNQFFLIFQHNYFANFPQYYPMTITMLIGSFIGGATSEGGGAVAFPVMTLMLKLSPTVARDFSLMVQCCGKWTADVLNILK